jgi:hypothetical protein
MNATIRELQKEHSALPRIRSSTTWAQIKGQEQFCNMTQQHRAAANRRWMIQTPSRVSDALAERVDKKGWQSRPRLQLEVA